MKMNITKVKQKTGLLLVNFGGPRDLHEIPIFLRALLCDQDVLQTPLPKFLHRALFSWIANRRSQKVKHDYASIGGKSPIYEDTEAVAQMLAQRLNIDVLTFHRYLPQTHRSFLQRILTSDVTHWTVFPMFPQFTYATTGSIARWMRDHLPKEITCHFSWVKSYGTEPAFVDLFARRIAQTIKTSGHPIQEWCLLFTAHGVPKKFILKSDPYQRECFESFQKISAQFPDCRSVLAYQSKFGPGEWIRPYTLEVSQQIEEYAQDAKHVLFVPLAFTSDHIETLFEIETEYMPLVRKKGYNVYRLSAFNSEEDWVSTIQKILTDSQTRTTTSMLIRQ